MPLYIVRARDWTLNMADQFGPAVRRNPGSATKQAHQEHELSDAQVVEAIINFGRATISERDDGKREIEFQNDYD